MPQRPLVVDGHRGAQPQAWTPGSPEHLVLHLPDRLGCFTHPAPAPCCSALPGTWRCSSALTPRPSASTPGAEALQVVCPVEADTPSTRVNDGRCDRAGNFVFGTLDEAEPRQTIAHYYQYSNAHGLRRLALPPVRIANSTCFSPDGRQIYFSDSPLQTIWVCDYDAASAQVSAPRLCPVARPQRDPDNR